MGDAELIVDGMTCAHCAQAVTTALTVVPGVTGVDVDVAGGRVLLRHPGPLDRPAVESAVADAGYQVVSWTNDPR